MRQRYGRPVATGGTEMVLAPPHTGASTPSLPPTRSRSSLWGVYRVALDRLTNSYGTLLMPSGHHAAPTATGASDEVDGPHGDGVHRVLDVGEHVGRDRGVDREHDQRLAAQAVTGDLHAGDV